MGGQLIHENHQIRPPPSSMSLTIPNSLRDSLITSFRYELCRKLGVVPFTHQMSWWAASDGYVLLDAEDPNGVEVQLGDRTVVKRAVVPRLQGRARVIADLGAFKIGKSWSSAMWAASFACVPNARIQLVGVEYDICSPEFEYLCEFLLSEAGMNIKPDSLQNRPRDGRMWMDLPNGARFEARSWERKDSMKGKEIDCYVYCEAFMLPGLECYTSFSQNLRARDGFAIFATTPDRPWVNEIHERAHSGKPEFNAWHCTCSVHSSANPLTFDEGAMKRDKHLMTREKFAIHYEGKLGDFVGKVYNYQRGSSTFSPVSHPHLFKPGSKGGRFDLHVPDGWEIVGGADTGTHTAAALVMFSPEGDAFIIDEFPNYSYVSGRIERDESITIPSWAKELENRVVELGGRCTFWADSNSQFKRELANYQIHLESNKTPLEARTEISREYFQNNRVFLAPWLSVLPFELENACWPDEATSAGKFSRIKDRDHTLDCVEHILSRRPKGKWIAPDNKKGSWLESAFGQRRRRGDFHLGTK